jgi:hypothetical protein
MLFSFMSQSNAYILFSPLLLATLMLAERHRIPPKALWLFFVPAYYVISLAYSDVTPPALRFFLRGKAIKPLGVLALVVVMLALLTREALERSSVRLRSNATLQPA